MIVEDGTSLSDADSLVSVDFADAYFELRNNSVWATLEDVDKEAALTIATDALTATYRTRWAGVRAKPTQALDWPRAYAPNPETQSILLQGGLTPYPGTPFVFILATVIPVPVMRAVCELAARSAAGTDLLPDQGKVITREKVDGAVEVWYDRLGPQAPAFTLVDRLVGPYLSRSGSSATVRLVRA